MPWLAALGSAAGTAATGAASALGAGAGAAASGLGSALGSTGGALGGLAQTGAGALSNGLGGALGSFGGALGEGGMGPATGASGFLGGLGQATGGMQVANPGLGSTLGQLTGMGLQARRGNRLGAFANLGEMTGAISPATRQALTGGGEHQQQKGLLSGLLTR